MGMAATPDRPLPKDREEKAKASLDEFTAGAKYRNPSAADLKIVAFDYIVLGDYPDADKWLTKMLEWAPNDSDGWYNLGRTKYNENRFAEAISAFQQCLKLDPKNVKAEDNLGLSFAGMGRNEEAAAAYQQAIAWQEQSLAKNPRPYIDLGSLRIDENRPKEAVTLLLQAVEIDARDSKTHELLGHSHGKPFNAPNTLRAGHRIGGTLRGGSLSDLPKIRPQNGRGFALRLSLSGASGDIRRSAPRVGRMYDVPTSMLREHPIRRRSCHACL
jgi:tetratricopeptide (TPR) repeat protein